MESSGNPWLVVGGNEARTAVAMVAAAERGDGEGWYELLRTGDHVGLIAAFSGLTRAVVGLLSKAVGQEPEAIYRLMLDKMVEQEAQR